MHLTERGERVCIRLLLTKASAMSKESAGGSAGASRCVTSAWPGFTKPALAITHLQGSPVSIQPRLALCAIARPAPPELGGTRAVAHDLSSVFRSAQHRSSIIRHRQVSGRGLCTAAPRRRLLSSNRAPGWALPTGFAVPGTGNPAAAPGSSPAAPPPPPTVLLPALAPPVHATCGGCAIVSSESQRHGTAANGAVTLSSSRICPAPRRPASSAAP